MSTIIIADNIPTFLTKATQKILSISELRAKLVSIWGVQTFVTCLQGA